MRYRAGDTVKIKEDLSEGRQYHDYEVVTDYMLIYAGEITTITKSYKNGTYHLDCDKGEWYWPEETLLPLVQSNADKIRQMSDEELAKFLSEFSACEVCNYNDRERSTCTATEFLCVKEYAEAIIGDWLQKPAEEDEE